MTLTPGKLGFIIILTVFGLGIAYFLKIPLVIGFFAGLAALIYFTKRSGFTMLYIRHSMWKGISHTKEVLWILLLVGLLIPALTACGTIPYLIDTGLAYMNPAYYLTIAFIFTAVVSMILGTSMGTLSSVGIPLMGAGALLQVSSPLLAAAIVSGVFVGDRTSPFSSANQLVAASTGTTVRKQFRYLAPTTVMALIASLLFFSWQDRSGSWHLTKKLLEHQTYALFFQYSFWLWAPIGILLVAMLLRLKTKYCFLLSIASSLLIGSILQDISFRAWMDFLWNGFSMVGLSTLHSKGLFSMLDLIALIMMTGAFNGILEETKFIQPYMLRLFGKSPLMGVATLRTVLFGLALALLSCTQTLPIMMSGRNILPVWSTRFRNEHLARVVADAPLVLAALVPWNMIAILCGTIVGVPVEQYMRYAIFLWILPLLTLSVSFSLDYLLKKEVKA
ncbi:MAG: Na+/H+ antiporter NhaC family protein [Paenibacillaceae bacterium]